MSDNPDTPTTPATPATQSAVGTLVQPKPAEALFVLHVLSNQEGKPKVSTAVFILIPFDHQDSYNAFFSLVFSPSLQVMIKMMTRSL